jgi:hypothetical protein
VLQASGDPVESVHSTIYPFPVSAVVPAKSTALSSNEGELARSITSCAPAMTSLRPSPVMVLTPLLGEAATTS